MWWAARSAEGIWTWIRLRLQFSYKSIWTSSSLLLLQSLKTWVFILNHSLILHASIYNKLAHLFCTKIRVTNSDYMIGSQIGENTWFFKPITFEESAIFMIKIGVITQSIILSTVQHLWPILPQPTLSELVCVPLQWNAPSQGHPTNSSQMKTTCTYVNSTNHTMVFNLQPCKLCKKARLSIKFAHHEWRIICKKKNLC